MHKFLIGGVMALALTSTSLSAAPLRAQDTLAGFDTSIEAPIWLAKNDKGKGKAKGHGNKKKTKKAKGHAGKANAGKGNKDAGSGKAKAKHTGNQKSKANGQGAQRASNGKTTGAKNRKGFTSAERENAITRLLSAQAPDGRDMARVLGAAGLALVTPQLIVSDIPDSELITYSNCPPGLAKKNPPCVPPGLAKDGVTYDEWASYDQDRYDTIWNDRRDQWLGSGYDVDPEPDLLLLQSDQIASLFDLPRAPSGQRYGLIDGMPVLLNDDDYTSLVVVNQLAQVPDLSGGVPIAPTAALTQDELISLYRLPQPGPDQSYAVVNGQLVQLENSEYELLQMLRVARAVL
ncbi:MAG: hypothetical protein RID15_09965 [Marinovum algicola]|uniref:hypothetical protein n=1 Tax=Marinovum algicola TaxID=42444 RepID=UPI0032EF49C4